MLKRFNATAIALLPKVTGADRMSQFRPISLCSTVYKVIARIIKNRLRRIIPDAVQLNQAGFVQGRLLCENVLLASELVTAFDKPADTTRGCLKVDLSKAYDNVHWGFLDNVLQAMELPHIFREWIKECVMTTSFSISINGELAGYFSGKKGLRQGDPISSLLFVLIMDVLSRLLDKGAVESTFGLHPSCQAPLNL
ncbi:secreted RxLR effector protein 78-like [Brassica napus]|uniref:secreted RxLR effector protein 78-like n=1 Tax=Brassica napus TaxID=3708 RepID=UPI0020792D3B|nr:secreted RxLR effector protein 78-like [Brassica napus]